MEVSEESSFASDSYYVSTSDTDETKRERLPVPYSKLEQILGENFIPLQSKIANIDSDGNEEFVLLYKKDTYSAIQLVIFDILPSKAIKENFSLEMAITKEDGLSLQVTNLFYEDDNAVLVDGRSVENDHHLYIISAAEDAFSLAGNFQGNYSVFTEYEENEEGISLLKDIVVINNTLSSTNTNIQEKEIFEWNYDEHVFTSVELSQILSTEIANIPQEVLYSSDGFFNYLSGFWYLEEYGKVVESGNLDPEKYENNNIRFIRFNFTEKKIKEVSVNHGEYIERYAIKRTYKLGGHKPGLRLILNDPTYSSHWLHRNIDVYLLSPTSLLVKGPRSFDEESYVRLQKQFSEYVTERKLVGESEKVELYREMLTGEYVFEDTMRLTIRPDSTFSLEKNDLKEDGMIKVMFEQDHYILSFLFTDNSSALFTHTYYLITENKREEGQGEEEGRDRGDSASFDIALVPAAIDFSEIRAVDVDNMLILRKQSEQPGL